MNSFKYKPYYSYNGPTASDPLREPLSNEDEQRNIELFYTDAINAFEDDDAVVTKDQDGIITIQTDLPKQECDGRIAQILTSLDLLGRKL
ncbi:hypothetical protein [Pseudomonas syringae]|uniref:hypothetical protein n=1 Tax=Pseudomonas syringae TaxID=317 RepID=UPI00053ADBF4|nr:hypothetical protein [Pseudomonas syringae]